MSYTYSGNPNASLIDETHYRLGNTDPSSPIATDEEVLLALKDNHDNTYLAAASILETKALQFAWRPLTVKKGDRQVTNADPQTFLLVARTLRMNASLQTTYVYAGGLSYGEKQSAARDTDLVQPFVGKDLHQRRRPALWAPTYDFARDEEVP